VSRESELDAVLVGGRTPGPVTLVEYDPGWPDRFAQRAGAVQAALGEQARLVEHIGSTSVPGLCAKPVIDIVVGIDDPDDEPAYLPDLEAVGYDVRVREPGHRCLRLGMPGDAVNLHCYPPDSDEITRYLAFRDRLRASDADRDAYAALKRSLAPRDWPDVNLYADAKGPLIREILGRAP
jgi:GrpB-like predicted nucleotidyltransferase (UPF0157 family)